MSPNGNDPAEPFEEKKDGTVDETAPTSQNDEDAKTGKNNVLQMVFVSLLTWVLKFGQKHHETSSMGLVTLARLCDSDSVKSNVWE